MATEHDVLSTLKEIVDPHTEISVYEKGLISDLRVSADSVSLTFRPTSPFCPLGIQLAHNIKRRILAVKGGKRADVKVVGHVQEQMSNKSLAEF